LCGCGLAQAARPRSGVKNRPLQLQATEFLLRIADGLSLGVSIRIVILDDSARALADEHSVQHEYGSVRLIARGLSEAPHLRGRLVPTSFLVAADNLGKGGQSQGGRGERHCTCKEGPSVQ
jgi:hypothetical protein